MSRSGYSDDLDSWDLIRWRGAVASAIRGKRGQAFLREMAAALDSLPDKMLIAGELQDAEGAVCAIGSVGRARGCPMAGIDPDDRYGIAKLFDIPRALACEIMYENDDYRSETPQSRFARIRKWVDENIQKATDQ